MPIEWLVFSPVRRLRDAADARRCLDFLLPSASPVRDDNPLTEPAASASPPGPIPDKTVPLHHFLVDSLSEYVVFAVCTQGLLISGNAVRHTFGYREEGGVIGRPFDLIFAPENVASDAPQHELTTVLSGEQTDHDRWHARKNGSRFCGTNTVQPMYAKDRTL